MPPTIDSPRSRIDRFLLLEELGRGGMGVVYRAVDEASGKPVALKVLLSGRHGDGEASERFLREARLSASVRHPHLVSVLEQGWNDDLPYLVQELVEGPTVEDAVANEGPMAPTRAAAIAAALADALHHAHSCGLVHRDVKPGNVLLAGPEDPRLTDFGLALDAASARLTATGQVLGTPTYMAPEQAVGERDVPGELSDQYSLGAVLYEMLAGRPPYEGDTAAQVLYSLVGEPPTSLASLRADLPRDLVTIVQRAMARQPARRYATCAALRDDLEAYLGGRPIVARPPSLAERVIDRLGQRGMRTVLALLVLGLGAGAAVGYTVVREVQIEQRRLAREAAAHDALSRLHSQLPGLEHDERARAIARFLEQPTNEGTAAAADLLLEEARRASDANQPELATQRYAEAFARSPDPEHHQAALLGLAEAFGRAWRFDDLSMLVHTLASSHPDAPGLDAWRGRASLARGDLAAVAAELRTEHRDAAAVWQVLSQARPTMEIGAGAVLTDWDGDGLPETTHTAEGATTVLRFEPGGPSVVGTLPTSGTSRLLPTTPPTVLQHHARDAGGPDRLVLRDRAGKALLTVPDAPFLAVVAGDADADGLDEVYIGVGPYTRHLVVLEEQPDGRWAQAAPLAAASSDITALLLDDLDADGATELLVAAGAWSAYDLRRYDVSGATPTLEQRTRLGYVPALARRSDGQVLMLDSDEYPSREGFPDGQQFGQPRGIWQLSPDLEPIEHLAVPGPEQLRLRTLLVADLDGDGDEELVVGAEEVGTERPSLLLWAATEAGYDGPWILPHATPVAAGPLDDDPADELVVAYHGETWVLGDGGEGLPQRSGPDRGTRRVPDDMPAPLAAAWRRAEVLVGMGLPEQGAASLLDLRRDGDAASAALLARAAELLGEAGQGTRAAELFHLAASADAAYRADAASALRRDHRVAAATRLGAEAPPWLDEERTVDLLATPGLFRDARRHGEGDVSLRVVTSGPPLAKAQLASAGHHLAIELELTLSRVEWGAGVVLRLSPPEGEAIEAGARGWGGGALLEREVGCLTEGITRSRKAIEGAAVAERWSMRIDVLDGELLCAIIGPDGVEQTDRRPFDLPAGPLTLELAASDHAGFLTHQLTAFDLHRLSVTAPELEITEVVPPEPGEPPGLADGSVTDEALQQALLSQPDALPRWLRLHSATLAPRLAQALGTASLPVFQTAYEATLHHHPRDPASQRALTVAAGPMLALPLDDATDEERLAAIIVRARRGMAFRQLGERGAARLDLQASADALRALRLRTSQQVPSPIGFLVHRELACLSAQEGDEDGARSHIDSAVLWHPAPEVAHDLLAARPELQGLL